MDVFLAVVLVELIASAVLVALGLWDSSVTRVRAVRQRRRVTGRARKVP